MHVSNFFRQSHSLLQERERLDDPRWSYDAAESILFVHSFPTDNSEVSPNYLCVICELSFLSLWQYVWQYSWQYYVNSISRRHLARIFDILTSRRFEAKMILHYPSALFLSAQSISQRLVFQLVQHFQHAFFSAILKTMTSNLFSWERNPPGVD